MPLKISYIFDYESLPTQGRDAASHKGGWTETIYQAGPGPNTVQIRNIASARARLLPQSVRIVGYRQQVVTITQAGLLGGGASVVLLGLTGAANTAPDLPQVALSLIAQVATRTNTRRFSLRGIPDPVMVNGEFQPSSTYRNNVIAYGAALVDNNALFPGRDLTQPIHQIESIIAGKLRTIGDIAVVLGDRVLLRRCRDENGNLVTGSYQVSAVAGRDVTLAGFDPTIVVGKSGLATVNFTVMCLISQVEIGRACVRKVGRPFEQYRGRRSKRR